MGQSPHTSSGVEESDLDSDITERMAIIEKAVRLQMTLGASHLQQVEMAPEAFGLTAASRPGLRSLRKQRNHALHHGLDAEPVSKDAHGPGQVEKLPTVPTPSPTLSATPASTPAPTTEHSEGSDGHDILDVSAAEKEKVSMLLNRTKGWLPNSPASPRKSSGVVVPSTTCLDAARQPSR